MRTVAVYPKDKVIPPRELSTFSIRQAHAGLLILNQDAIQSLCREVLKRRGEPNPDMV